MVSPKTKIKRPKKLVTLDELLAESSGVTIREYTGPLNSKFAKIKFEPVVRLMVPRTLPKTLNVDLRWHIEGLFSNDDSPRPNWSGYMDLMASGDHLSNSDITFVPIIDLNPSSYTCIYSTLTYVTEQCQKLNIKTPSITFDQPLWLKATEIVIDKSFNVVVHLGGFHTLMSFMGSIGTMMDSSGLYSPMETIYGENTVKHILTGKAISRAVRGHLLVKSALYTKLLGMVFSDKTITEYSTLSSEDFKIIQDGTISDNSIVETEVMKKFNDCMQELRNYLSENSRTAKLWIQFMDYVDLMRQTICAARSGDWNLSLDCFNSN